MNPRARFAGETISYTRKRVVRLANDLARWRAIELFLPHIAVYLYAVRLQQRFKLGFEVELLMMFFLIADVITNRIKLRFTNCKSTPMKGDVLFSCDATYWDTKDG